MGDRKFDFIGKGYYYDKANNLFSEMNFEDTSGIFASNKWKYKDQVEAELFTVKPQFIDKFLKDFPDKKPSPGKGDIIQRHYKL
jgi:hypothetical protein